MHYLIDGHNLIGKMPDIHLDDPNDEAKLVVRLRGWLYGQSRHRLTIIFDGTMAGGRSTRLSGKGMEVIFAPSGVKADALLIRRIKQTKTPGNITLVTSDNEIIRAANARRMPHLPSEQFIRQLEIDLSPEPEPEPSEKPDDSRLSDAEVQEWLDLFGPVKPRPKPKPKPRKAAKPAEPEKPTKKRPLRATKDENVHLEKDEIDEWLALFATAPKPERPSAPPSANKKEESKPTQKPRKPRQLGTRKHLTGKLSEDEVDEWMRLFNEGKE